MEKEQRFEAISPMFMAGSILFPSSHILLAELVKELLDFPAGKHDDMVDSLSQALNWARGISVKRGVLKLKGTF